jgi:hypothetical protein
VPDRRGTSRSGDSPGVGRDVSNLEKGIAIAVGKSVKRTEQALWNWFLILEGGIRAICTFNL